MSKEQAIERTIDEAKAPRHEGEHANPPAAGSTVMRIFALGHARVEQDGRPLDSPEWIQKPRKLLYYLLSHPEGRTKEEIGLALWPEASTSRLRSSFHDTLYRLRRALGGKEWISFEKGRYAFGRSLDYFYDVDAFEEKLSEAAACRPSRPSGSSGTCGRPPASRGAITWRT